MFVGKGKHTVSQVAPGGDQFVIVAVIELVPVPIRIARFRHDHGQVVAQRIRVVTGEEIQAPNRPIAAAGDLLSFQVEEFIGRYVVGQHERRLFFTAKFLVKCAVRSQQFRRPDDGVEGNVVLANKVQHLGILILPPGAPGIRITLDLAPFNGRGQVADDGFEPHVQAFLVPAFHRNRDTPFQVAGDGTPAQAFGLDLAQRLAQYIRAPIGFARFEESLDFRLQFAQVQEIMFRFTQFGNRTVDARTGVDQFGGVQQVAALVALVAARIVVAADIAGAFHVAVRQKAALAG